MFGLFKKPDSSKTTQQCLEVWEMLTPRDQKTSAQNIHAISRLISRDCTSPTEAILMLGKFKQEVIQKYALSNHVHPAYMQVQILSDFIFSAKQNAQSHEFAHKVLNRMIASLDKTEQADIFRSFSKFI